VTLDAEVAARFDRIRSRAKYLRTRGRRSRDVLMERRGSQLLAQLNEALKALEESVPDSIPASRGA
jgi:hypothetical protein